MSKLFFFLLIFCAFSIHAKTHILMTVNHPSPSLQVRYYLNMKDCRPLPETSIQYDIYHPDKKTSRDPNILESVYFGISHSNISNDKIIFTVNSLKNAQFFVRHKRKEGKCIPKKEIQFEGKRYPLKKTNINYHNRLAFPTLDAIEFYKEERPSASPTLEISDYQAKGYMPFYEFKLGMASYLHSNIRPNDQRLFHRQSPVIKPQPAFIMRYGPFFLNQDGLGSLLYASEHLSALGAFILEGEPYEGENIRERERSIFFGPLIKSHFLEIHYYRDLMSKHDGEVLKVSLAPKFRLLSNYILNPRLYYQYWDKNYVNYYFGVNNTEAGHIGHSYEGSPTHNYGFSVRQTIKFNKFEYFTNAELKYYGLSVRNSPLTIRSSEFRFLAGFVYNFF